MYSYIIGKITKITKKYLVLENNNIGYMINMSEKSLKTYDEGMDNICIYTYQNVREDEISLFGFKTIEEKNLFEELITVSGIGAKTAITMLSTLEVSEFVVAIISSDIDKLTKIPGIGKKTAQRIIIELQDKLKAPKDMEEILKKEIPKENTEKYDEIESALRILGYSTKEINNVLSKVDLNKTIEEALKEALKLI